MMARKRIKNLWPIAVSVTAAAEILGVRLPWLRRQVAENRLVAYVLDDNGAKILVQDLVAFVRTFPVKR
jgi:hypothetical protein